jgi:hypothetical protein
MELNMSGGAVSATTSKGITVRKSIFSNNNAEIGGGLYLQGNFDIDTCTFQRNFASDSGGGAFIGTNPVICHFDIRHIHFIVILMS